MHSQKKHLPQKNPKNPLREGLLSVPSVQNAAQFLCCLKGNGQGPWSNSWSLLSIPPFNNKCLGYSHIQRGCCQVKRRINRTLPMALSWSLKCSFRLDAPVLSNTPNVNQENSSAWMNMTTTKLKSLVNVELIVGLRQFRLLLFSSLVKKLIFPFSHKLWSARMELQCMEFTG